MASSARYTFDLSKIDAQIVVRQASGLDPSQVAAGLVYDLEVGSSIKEWEWVRETLEDMFSQIRNVVADQAAACDIATRWAGPAHARQVTSEAAHTQIGQIERATVDKLVLAPFDNPAAAVHQMVTVFTQAYRELQ